MNAGALTEAILPLKEQVTYLADDVKILHVLLKDHAEKMESVKIELAKSQERLSSHLLNFEKLERFNKEQAEKIESLKIELAKTQEKLANHLLNYEKHDNRRWTLVGFFIASLLALMANLIVTFTRK